MGSYITLWTTLGVLYSLVGLGHTGTSGKPDQFMDIKYNISKPQSCYSEDGVYSKLLEVPMFRCVFECAIRPRCLAVNHRFFRNTCELIDKADDSALKDGYCQYVRKSEMDVDIPCKGCSKLQACDVLTRECVYKECPVPKVANARIMGYQNSVGSSIRVFCHRGYKAINGAVVSVCKSDGQWSSSLQCVWDETAGIDENEPVSNREITYNGLYFNPAANCTAISSLLPITDGWCMSNCNHIPTYCPENLCECTSNNL